MILAWAAWFGVLPLQAGELRVKVTDDRYNPLKDAVVYRVGRLGGWEVPGDPFRMRQIDREFTPSMLVIPVGASVVFPNEDDVFHHLYSFSKVKPFEIPLSKGKSHAPVLFDKPGIAKIGCNIHDWMNGTIVVLENPHFVRTNERGRGRIKDLPENEGVEVEVFHPRLRGKTSRTRRTVVWKKGKAKLSWKLRLSKGKKKRPPKPGEFGGYGN